MKFDNWNGGLIFSGTSTMDELATAGDLWANTDLSDENVHPLYSSGKKSNTFLRIDIDDAPTAIRGEILWASSGTDMVTGKPMSLPIRTMSGANGEIPNYYMLQSKSKLDSGKNINTLNGISVCLPLFVSVRVDPDVLNNYASVGTVSGVTYISTLNTQTGKVYEINYPDSGKISQTFPFGRRRGYYGFDGLAIKQAEDV